MMKGGFGFWIFFMVFGTALLFLCFSSIPGGDDLVHRNKIVKLTKPGRKLKEDFYDESGNGNGNGIGNGNGNGNVNEDDYFSDDPVPSSKATSLRPGPIEHGTPLMPYLPNPTPPSPGPNVGFP